MYALNSNSSFFFPSSLPPLSRSLSIGAPFVSLLRPPSLHMHPLVRHSKVTDVLLGLSTYLEQLQNTNMSISNLAAALKVPLSESRRGSDCLRRACVGR